jgi:insulysin
MSSDEMKIISNFFKKHMSNVLVQNDNLKQNGFKPRKTRYIELPNKMKFLLVSDSESHTSSCSLNVNVGSMLDPKEFPGLAHLVEHMLTTGSKPFPKDDHFKDFVKKRSGQKKSDTGEDYTNFLFEIDCRDFRTALEIFSSYFKEPLFTPSQAGKCMKIVDDEFLATCKEEGRRIYNIENTVVASKDSKLNRFTNGNMQSLQKEGVYGALVDFYKQNYSSNLMTVAMIGNHTLDEL